MERDEAMDDETLSELAKRWCLKGIFKMGTRETAERARVDAWDLVVEVRRLRDRLGEVERERDALRDRLAAARAATDDLPRHLGATWWGQRLRAALVDDEGGA